MYTLAESLRLRGRKRTFCAFVDGRPPHGFATCSRCHRGLGRFSLKKLSVGIGPDKNAVLAVGCRTHNFNFTLHGVPVPVVSEYCYSGVVLQSSRNQNRHGQIVYASSNRKFHQFLTWSENRQLHTSFRCGLFNSYGLSISQRRYPCLFEQETTSVGPPPFAVALRGSRSGRIG